MPAIQHTYEDPYVLGPVLDARLGMLQKHLDQQFDDLKGDISRIEHQMDGLDQHTREHVRLIETRLTEHENRICNQERHGWWRLGISIASFVLAIFGIRFPE